MSCFPGYQIKFMHKYANVLPKYLNNLLCKFAGAVSGVYFKHSFVHL